MAQFCLFEMSEDWLVYMLSSVEKLEFPEYKLLRILHRQRGLNSVFTICQISRLVARTCNMNIFFHNLFKILSLQILSFQILSFQILSIQIFFKLFQFSYICRCRIVNPWGDVNITTHFWRLHRPTDHIKNTTIKPKKTLFFFLKLLEYYSKRASLHGFFYL